jgi:SPP1 family predicted phage head-tail adaptor
MTLASGDLRHRILLQSQVHEQDEDTGEITIDWRDRGHVWAALHPLSTREVFAAQASQSKVTARFIIRHRADIDGSWRIKYRGKVWNIEGVLADKDSGLEYLTLPAYEGVNDGQ